MGRQWTAARQGAAKIASGGGCCDCEHGSARQRCWAPGTHAAARPCQSTSTHSAAFERHGIGSVFRPLACCGARINTRPVIRKASPETGKNPREDEGAPGRFASHAHAKAASHARLPWCVVPCPLVSVS